MAKKTIISNMVKAEYSASKALKSEKGTKVPLEGRKSLREDVSSVKKEITPSSPPLNALPFMVLMLLYKGFKGYIRLHGGSCKFNGDLFVVLLSIVCFSGVRVGLGVSVNDLMRGLYFVDSNVSYRMLMHRLLSLVGSGLVVSYNDVTRKCLLYRLSVDAENVIYKYVSRSELRKLNAMVRGFIK